MRTDAAPAERLGPFAPGDMCGPHEIVGEYGRGGMAIIYQAISPLGEQRAIKVLQQQRSFTKGQQKRFWREIGVLRSIVSDHVVRFFEAGQQGKVIWLAMEFLQGDTVAQLIADHDGGMPPDSALHLALQIARGLRGIHKHRVIHRDLKPENIIVEGTAAKIFDFGIAQYEGCFTTTQERPPVTPSYMSPEQAAADRLDPRTDIFNFGLIFYELLTGRHALGLSEDCATMSDLFARIMHRDAEPIGEHECPPQLAAIARRALQRDREKRFATAAELEHALVKVLRGQRDEQWAATVEAISAFAPPPPVSPRPTVRVTESGEYARNRPSPQLRVVRSDRLQQPHTEPMPPEPMLPERGAAGRHHTEPMPPERGAAGRHHTEPMPPERIAAGVRLRGQHDTVPLDELAVPAEPPAPVLPVRQRPRRRPRSMISRTLFTALERKSRRDRWLMFACGAVLAVLVSVPFALLIARMMASSAEEAASPPVIAEPVVEPAAEQSTLPVAEPPMSEPLSAGAASAVAQPSIEVSIEPEPSALVPPSPPVYRPRPAPPRASKPPVSGRTDHGF